MEDEYGVLPTSIVESVNGGCAPRDLGSRVPSTAKGGAHWHSGLTGLAPLAMAWWVVDGTYSGDLQHRQAPEAGAQWPLTSDRLPG